tara:strand:- start:7752 stop:7901 length:150 start_codon:yes stop_codon:yes gene_type:complete
MILSAKIARLVGSGTCALAADVMATLSIYQKRQCYRFFGFSKSFKIEIF